jgi:Cytochrome c oxidase subunit IV
VTGPGGPDGPGDRPAATTEGPGGHEARSPTDDRAVPRRVFLAVAGFYGVLAAIYGATAYEWAGTVMLVIATVLGVWCAAYLWLQLRPAAVAGAEAGEPWLPHASVWPFVIGLGAATVLNGLVLGLWVIVPGAALMALGIGGFVLQSRRRD